MLVVFPVVVDRVAASCTVCDERTRGKRGFLQTLRRENQKQEEKTLDVVKGKRERKEWEGQGTDHTMVSVTHCACLYCFLHRVGCVAAKDFKRLQKIFSQVQSKKTHENLEKTRGQKSERDRERVPFIPVFEAGLNKVNHRSCFLFSSRC